MRIRTEKLAAVLRQGAVAGIAGLLAAGCAIRGPATRGPGNGKPLFTRHEGARYVEVPVYYATDRAETGRSAPHRRFGTERGELSYGLCKVSIPDSHRRGVLESPSLWRFEFRKDPEKHVVLMSLEPLGEEAFLSSIRSRNQQAADEAQLLVFIHGFNVSFHSAVRRTAQLVYDLNFPGTAVTYSWPTRGLLNPWGYTTDTNTAEWTVPHCTQVLEALAARTGAGRIHVLAHSMGNRTLGGALSRLAEKHDRRLFHQVILAAPDIDAEVFARDIAPRLDRAARRVTLYASSDDKALAFSRTLNGYPRAGDTEGGPVLASGVDTVDVSGVDVSLLGLDHTYYADVENVVRDIHRLLLESLAPAQRDLEPVTAGDGAIYWRMAR